MEMKIQNLAGRSFLIVSVVFNNASCG